MQQRPTARGRSKSDPAAGCNYESPRHVRDARRSTARCANPISLRIPDRCVSRRSPIGCLCDSTGGSVYLPQAGSSCETGGLPIEDSDAASMRRGSAIPVGERVEATGGWIGFGEAAQTEYPIRRLADGEHVSLGEVDLEILSTPGHTWESISVLVRERADAPPTAVLSGDSLFIGDVGRPDLVKLGDGSSVDLARAQSGRARAWRHTRVSPYSVGAATNPPRQGADPQAHRCSLCGRLACQRGRVAPARQRI